MNNFLEAAIQAEIITRDAALAAWKRVFEGQYPTGGTPWDQVLFQEWNEQSRESFEGIRDFYENDAYFVFICSMSGWPNPSLCPLIRPVFRPEMRVLDFGCGHGNVGLSCAQLGASTLCADASRRVLRVIDHLALTTPLPIETLLVQQVVPELGTEQYDLVSSIDCLEHVQDPLGVLNKLVVATKHGGYLRLSVFFGDHKHAPYHLPQHAALGNYGAFRGVCEKLGLELIETEPGTSDNGLYRRN
jgi:2-polyprenyl-3-methyl-5-hydroxy-6-metoxy-1,4-benzoquinol methylase